MPRGRGWRRFRVSTLAMPTGYDHRCGFAIREILADLAVAAMRALRRQPRRLTRVDALVWWLIPLVSSAVAVIWTTVLARRERRRSSPQWRAQRLAEVGHVLAAPRGPSSSGQDRDEAGSDGAA